MDELLELKALLSDDSVDAGVDAVETALIALRDARVSLINARRGLVIEDRNHPAPSALIRMTIEDAIRLALAGIALKRAKK